MIRIIKSLRFRIAILIFLFCVVPINVGLFVYTANIESRKLNSLSITVNSQAQLISNYITNGGYFISDTNRYTLGNRLSTLKEVSNGRIMIMDNTMKILLDTYDVYENKTLIWENALRSLGGESLSYYDEVNKQFVVSIPIGSSSDIAAGSAYGVVMISRNTDYIDGDMSFYKRIFLISAVISVVIGLGGAIFFSKLLVIPLNNLSKDIDVIVKERAGSLTGYGIAEIDKVSDSVNEFAAKLSEIDNTMKDFVSNVSHELKTPLTSMKIMADTLLATEDTPVDFYRDFMSDISSEIDRETNIINDLLTMTKTNVDTASMEVETVNVNEFLEGILKILSPVAEKAGVELLIETFKPVVAQIDRVKLSQALINLIENAIKYNMENGYVHVTVNADSKNCFIRVEDGGIGIPEDDLGLIFERFYRVDKSHSKEIDGTGLGLSIVKNIITLHGGEIKVDSIEGKGTTFTVKLPLVQKI